MATVWLRAWQRFPIARHVHFRSYSALRPANGCDLWRVSQPCRLPFAAEPTRERTLRPRRSASDLPTSWAIHAATGSNCSFHSASMILPKPFDLRKATATVMLIARSIISLRAFRWSIGTLLRTSRGEVVLLLPLATLRFFVATGSFRPMGRANYQSSGGGPVVPDTASRSRRLLPSHSLKRE